MSNPGLEATARTAWRRGDAPAVIRASWIAHAKRALDGEDVGQVDTRCAWGVLGQAGPGSDPGLWLALVVVDCVAGRRCWIDSIEGEALCLWDWHAYNGDLRFLMTKLAGHIAHHRTNINLWVGIEGPWDWVKPGSIHYGARVLVRLPQLSDPAGWWRVWDALERRARATEDRALTWAEQRRRQMPYWTEQVKTLFADMLGTFATQPAPA